jgi:fructose-bisphosphate aldolase, class II
MQPLRDVISDTSSRGGVIWHFNFSEFTALKAAARVARELNVPIIMGLSEGERDFVGVREAVALIKSYRAEGIRIYLNADHTKTFEGVKAAVEAGFDAVIFDGSALPLAENIRETKRVVEYVRMVNPRIIVEGELGYIGTKSEVLEKVPDGVQKTTPEEAVRFVKETGVDMFAPAVGNVHGMLKSGHEPALDIALIKKIKDVVQIPLVLHGASGNTDTDIHAAIKAGIAVIHINTEIRRAWREKLEESLKGMPSEVAPYKLLAAGEEAVYQAIKSKIGAY